MEILYSIFDGVLLFLRMSNFSGNKETYENLSSNGDEEEDSLVCTYVESDDL